MQVSLREEQTKTRLHLRVTCAESVRLYVTGFGSFAHTVKIYNSVSGCQDLFPENLVAITILSIV